MSVARISPSPLAAPLAVALLALAAPAAAQVQPPPGEGQLPRTLVAADELLYIYNVGRVISVALSDASPPQTQIVYGSCLYDKTLRALIADVRRELAANKTPSEQDIARALNDVCIRSPVIKPAP